MAQNRIKVLQINDDKNNLKLNNQVGLITKIQQVRDSSSLHHHYVFSFSCRLRVVKCSCDRKLKKQRTSTCSSTRSTDKKFKRFIRALKKTKNGCI
jgi:hypothetical protein